MRHGFTFGLLASVAVPLIPSTTRAQLAGAVQLSSAVGRAGAEPWRRESQFAPFLRGASGSGYLHFDGLLIEQEGRLAIRHTYMEGAAVSPAFGAFRLSLSGAFRDDRSASPPRTTSLDVSSALSVRRGVSGAWLGVARSNSMRSDDDVPSAQLIAGAWRVIRGAVVSLSSHGQQLRTSGMRITSRQETYPDSIYTDSAGWSHFQRTRTRLDTGTLSRVRSLADLEARVDWAAGRVSFGAAMAGRPAVDSVRALIWGRVNAGVQLSPHVTFVASGGTLPGRGLRASASRFVTLGIRVSQASQLRSPLPAAIRPVATAFAVRQVADGQFRITMRVPSARTVELSGSFNQWTPVRLTETAPNRWEVTLPIAPGTHRINVRVDGDAWRAPPGLPAIDDEFNGRVGVVVIK